MDKARIGTLLRARFGEARSGVRGGARRRFTLRARPVRSWSRAAGGARHQARPRATPGVQTLTQHHSRRLLGAVPVHLAVAGALLGLAACAGTGGDALDKAPVYVERPVELLYNEARDLLADRRYTEAVRGFEEVDRQHPYSEWARRSLLMSAYAQYQQNKYEDAVAGAQRYVALYPGSDSAPYGYYLIAMCYFEQIVDVGRDQRMTELALASLNDVVQRFPQTEYARDARLKIEMTQDQLAGKEMEIGRFYLRGDQHLAAIGRFKRVVDLYQTTTHVPEALHRLVEAYVSLGIVGEATKVGAVLGYNYPGSEWYEASYRLLTTRGAAPRVTPVRQGLFGRVRAEETGLPKPPRRGLFGRRAPPPPVTSEPAPAPPPASEPAPAAPSGAS
jgi:outer membrane protein assembly factor BamD